MAGRRWRRPFQWLLSLFPSEFRGDFGAQMAADFDDQGQEAAARGRHALVRLWARTSADLLRRAPIEHLDILRRDAAYAVRLLRRRRGFTALIVLTLGIGIGLNTAVFSIVEGVLLRGLPFPASDRLVRLNEVQARQPDELASASSGNFIDWQVRTKTLDALALSSRHPAGVLLTTEGEPEAVAGLYVSSRFFDLLGVRPLLGRLFTPDEYANATLSATRDASSVVVLGFDLWQRHFSGRRDIVGTSLRLGDRVLEVVGVLPSEVGLVGVADLDRPDFVTPVRPNPDQRGARYTTVIGRLAPGISLGQAQAEFDTMSASMARAYPENDDGWAVRLTRPLENVVEPVRRQVWLVAGAALCLLAIAAANVSSLLLTFGVGRRRELATRVAVGATRGHLIRQLLTEGLALSGLGGVAGVVLASWAVPALIGAAPDNIPRLSEVSLDRSALAFALGVSVLLGIGCALAAALRPAALGLRSAVRVTGDDRSMTDDGRFRRVLTVAQVALAMILVVAAVLLVRTIRALGAVELGFSPDHVIAMQLNAELQRYGGVLRVAAFQRTVIDQVRRLPGVVAVGTGRRPLAGGTGMIVSAARDRPGEPTEVEPVSPGYLAALRIRVVHGRVFNEDDLGSASAVAVLSESAARHFWNDNPIGKTLYLDGTDPVTIIGVVSDVRRGSLEAAFEPIVYILQTRSRFLLYDTLLVRTENDPEAIVPAVRAILKRADPAQPLTQIETLQEILDRQTAPRRFLLRLIGLFSILALGLAMLGTYGVLAESVAQRVPAIGVRMALGATPAAITWSVVGQGTWLVAVGIAVGWSTAFLARHAMTGVVFGVPTWDPMAYTAAGLGVVGAALAACALPARRAASVDPAVALRHE